MSMPRSADRSAQDWIRAAAGRLVRDGIGAVAIEALARDLGVTKGSFYWHFRDRPALLEALLVDWGRRSTEPLLERLRRAADAPAARLGKLAATVAGEGSGALDPSIRAWALHDRLAAEILRRVDEARLAFIAGEFRALGFAPQAACTRARLFYLHLLGEHALGLGEPGAPLPERLAEAARVLELLTSSQGSRS
jgi:AcrR family transcriptional regulator